jgi:hypothetical protein
MRLLLHVLVLVAASVAIGRWRARTYWRGTRDAFGVEVSETLEKGRVRAMQVGARTQAAVEFEIAPETGFDRWAKRHGLAVEPQLGERGFDQSFYLATDDPYVLTGLQFDPELPAVLRELLLPLAPGVRLAPGIDRVRRVVCRAGVVRVELDVDVQEADDVGRNHIIAALASHLLSLAEGLDASAGKARPDPYRVPVAWLPAIAGALAINAFLQGGRISMPGLPDTVEHAPLWQLGVPLGLALLIALVFSAWRRVGRSSRAHRVLRAIAVFGVAGALGTGVAAVRDANIELDGSMPRRHDSVVLGRYTTQSRKSTSYYVTVRGWPGHGPTFTFAVRERDFRAYRVSRPVVVVEREGWLGARWVEAVEP